VNIVKQEGQLMADMDRVNSDIRYYLDSLTQLLNRKAASLTALQKRLLVLPIQDSWVAARHSLVAGDRAHGEELRAAEGSEGLAAAGRFARGTGRSVLNDDTCTY